MECQCNRYPLWSYLKDPSRRLFLVQSSFLDAFLFKLGQFSGITTKEALEKIIHRDPYMININSQVKYLHQLMILLHKELKCHLPSLKRIPKAEILSLTTSVKLSSASFEAKETANSTVWMDRCCREADTLITVWIESLLDLPRWRRMASKRRNEGLWQLGRRFSHNKAEQIQRCRSYFHH